MITANRMTAAIGSLLLVAGMTGLCAEAAKPQDNGMMRIVAPVRLSSERGDGLAAQVAETRKVLEKFQEGGYGHAIWAVDELPAKKEDMKPWVATCVKAFPGPVIVALDMEMEGGKASLPADRLETFLSAVSDSVVAKKEAGGGVSILLNFTRLSNCACFEEGAPAMAATLRNARIARKSLPGAHLWLLLDDCKKAAPKIPEWIAALGDAVDGFYLNRPHVWNAETEGERAGAVFKTGKPVIRGGFTYQCPRMRRGVEEHLVANYRKRMSVYEQWIVDSAYAGYSREIGQGIPGNVSVNMNLLPGAGGMSGSGEKQ